MKFCLAMLLSAITVAGCSSATPTAATAVPSITTHLTGTVFDSAFRAIPGVRIEAMGGTAAGVAATTEAHGYFDLHGTFDATTRFRVSKDGYITTTGTFLSALKDCELRVFVAV